MHKSNTFVKSRDLSKIRFYKSYESITLSAMILALSGLGSLLGPGLDSTSPHCARSEATTKRSYTMSSTHNTEELTELVLLIIRLRGPISPNLLG